MNDINSKEIVQNILEKHNDEYSDKLFNLILK